jgi:hypothetical protein
MPDIGRSKQLWKLNGGWMRGYSALPGAASVSREGATDPPPPLYCSDSQSREGAVASGMNCMRAIA